jgi:two-component system LytT family sensor kinase
MRNHGHSLARILAWQLASWSFWAFAAPFVVRIGSELAEGQGRSVWGDSQVRFSRGPLRILVVALVLFGAHAIAAAQFTVWLQPLTPVVTHRLRDALIDQLGLLLVLDLLAYVVLLMIGGAITVTDRARRLELRESRLEAELARANLDALRLEIQPHFLFNTLNTIGALIRRGSSDHALEMLVGLSDLLRNTLDRRRVYFTPLETELEFVRKYIDLNRVRFSDRLEVAYEIDPAAGTHLVPTFILQPLVENAFRHGLSRQWEPCRVEIGARIVGECLRLWVADNGVGIAPDFLISRDAGTGLSNVLSRLECLFGPAARIEVHRRQTGGTMAEIVLPFISAEQATHAVPGLAVA